MASMRVSMTVAIISITLAVPRSIPLTFTITVITPAAVTFLIFFFLLQATHKLIERRAAQVIRVKSTIFLKLLYARTYLLPCVSYRNWWLKVLNLRSEIVNCATLVAFCVMFVLFVTLQDFVAETFKDY
jgi:hypothetical protein